jgi:hypothetical protein
VYLERPETEPFHSPVPVLDGFSSLDHSPAEGGWLSTHSFVRENVSVSSSSLDGCQIFQPSPEVPNLDIATDKLVKDVPLDDVFGPTIPIRPQRRKGEMETFVDGLDVSSSVAQDTSRNGKRPRIHEQPHPDQDTLSTDVSRKERAVLLRLFKKEQRFKRKQYRASVRPQWNVEIDDAKENAQGKEACLSPTRDPETVAEAFEDYLFDRMSAYDEDAALQLADFRSTLRIVPAHLE